MKKFVEVLKNPAVTIFLWLLAAASEVAICIQAVRVKGAPAIACVVMLIISTVLLLFRYLKKK